jgi:hypothetical protein
MVHLTHDEAGGLLLTLAVAVMTCMIIAAVRSRHADRIAAEDERWERERQDAMRRLPSQDIALGVSQAIRRESEAVYSMLPNHQPRFTGPQSVIFSDDEPDTFITAHRSDPEDDTAAWLPPWMPQVRGWTDASGTWRAPLDVLARLPRGDWLRSLLISAEVMHVTRRQDA